MTNSPPHAIVQIEIPLLPGITYLSRLEAGSIHKALALALPDLRKAARLDASAAPAHLKPTYLGNHAKTKPKKYNPSDGALATQVQNTLNDKHALTLTIRFDDQTRRSGYLVAHRRELL